MSAIRTQLEYYSTGTKPPYKLIEQISSLGSKVPGEVLTAITAHIKSISQREPIFICLDALDKKIIRLSKKKNERSKYLLRQLLNLRKNIKMEGNIGVHKPIIKPFHTITGRDSAVGSAIHYISKDHWQSLLMPPNGYTYVLLDYEQQEFMIAAALANHDKLIDIYSNHDVYERLNSLITQGQLTRKEFKVVILCYLNGMQMSELINKLNFPSEIIKSWLLKLNRLIGPLITARYRGLSYDLRKGELRSLDWRLVISSDTKKSTIANWPLQAAGADIMRRACINLDKANIPILLTNHDSFLVKLDTSNFENQCSLAIQSLVDASAEVLKGFNLKVKVEKQIPSKAKEI